ncbi:MAG: hypothetical protein ACOX52_06745 [Verrucomicrobiota bacterium]
MDPTHPHNQVENVTAPSAGGFPGPDGEDSRRSAEAQRGRAGNSEIRWSCFLQLTWSAGNG